MAANSDVLPWKSRWSIAVGAARGVRFLHEESLVRWVTQQNNSVQQSNSVDSKTAGPGMSCFLASDRAETNSVTDKADVYAFGVMVLELITGRKAVETMRARGPMTLVDWAAPFIEAGNTAELVDPRLQEVYDVHQLNALFGAAGRCISNDTAHRPAMSEVLRLLEQVDASSDRSLSREDAPSSGDLAGLLRHESLQDSRSLRSALSIHPEGSLDSLSGSMSSDDHGAPGIQRRSQSRNLQSSRLRTDWLPRRKLPYAYMLPE